MHQFKKGQIVYVSDGNQEFYLLRHFASYKHSDAYPYKTSYDYQKAIKGIGCLSFRYCLSVEDYQKKVNQPKDKDLVWAWDNAYRCARDALFYDAENKRTFNRMQNIRGGDVYDNYEVIPRDQWPEWAIEAYEYLED